MLVAMERLLAQCRTLEGGKDAYFDQKDDDLYVVMYRHSGCYGASITATHTTTRTTSGKVRYTVWVHSVNSPEELAKAIGDVVASWEALPPEGFVPVGLTLKYLRLTK